MAQRFFNIFNLTEQQAIALLKTPLAQLEDLSDRYLAASHLASFPSLNSINALIETVENQDRHQFHRIARRKAIESLGRLKATKALSVIRACLADEDCYTVENAVWALGEIGTLQSPILAEISQLLEKPQQSYP